MGKPQETTTSNLTEVFGQQVVEPNWGTLSPWSEFYICFLSVDHLLLLFCPLPNFHVCAGLHVYETGRKHVWGAWIIQTSSLCCIILSCLLPRNEKWVVFSFFCSTSVHGSILSSQQFIYHPHRLEPHFRAERPPEGVRVNWERAAHLQWLWHRAVFAKDIWQKSVSISCVLLSVKDHWAKLILLCAKSKKYLSMGIPS